MYGLDVKSLNLRSLFGFDISYGPVNHEPVRPCLLFQARPSSSPFDHPSHRARPSKAQLTAAALAVIFPDDNDDDTTTAGADVEVEEFDVEVEELEPRGHASTLRG
jgi:hypothetical protein